MKHRIPKINTYFRLGLLCLIIKTIFGTSEILRIEGIVDDLLAVVGSAFLLMSVVKKGCKAITYCVYAVVMLLALYTSYRIGNLRMLMVVAMCVAATRQNLNETIRFLFTYETIFLFLHILVALATSVFGRSNYIYMSGVRKYTFGFGHPNTLSCLLTNVLMMWSWLNFERLRRSHILIQILVVMIIYLFTGTRTILLTAFIFTLLVCYLKLTRRDLHLLVRYLIPIAVVCHLIAIPMYISGHPLALVLNKVLSTRIKLGAYWYTHEGLSVFGQNLTGARAVWDEVWQFSGEIPFDNIYTYLLINIGIVWIVILSVLFYRISFEGNAKKNLFLIVWALYGVTEVHGINPVMLFPLLLLVSDVHTSKIHPESKSLMDRLFKDGMNRENAKSV